MNEDIDTTEAPPESVAAAPPQVVPPTPVETGSTAYVYPEANSMAEAARLVADDQGARMRANLLASQGVSSAVTAKALDIAGKLGAPVDTVERNLVDFEAIAKRKQYAAILDGSPLLKQWMLEPVNLKVGQDDIEKLAKTESVWRGLADTLVRAPLGGAVNVVGSSIAGVGEAYDIAKWFTGKLFDMGGVPDTGVSLPWYLDPGEILRRGGGRIKDIGEFIDVPKERQTFGDQVTGGVGQIAGQIAQMIMTGGGATILSMFGQGVDQMVDQVKATGKYDTAEGKTAIIAGGGITALTEKMGLDLILNRVPPAIKNKVLRAGADILLSGGIEAAEEFLEQAAQNGVVNVLTRSQADYQPLFEGALDAAAPAFFSAGLVRGGLMAAGRFSQPKPQAKDDRTLDQRWADRQAQAVDALVASVNETNLSKMSPEKMAEYLADLAKHTGDQNVFIPAETVQTFLQSKPLEDMQRFADALGISEQLPEALARGGDVVIPLAKYVSEAGKSDAHKAWLNDLRLEVDGLSVRQAEEEAKTQKERTKLAVERFEKQLEAGIAEVDATTRVYEDMRDKLKTLGQYTNDAAEQQAALFAERYAARAARNPGSYLDAWDAYSKAGMGKGLEIQTVLSDRVRAMPPDELDVLLNSIRSGKVAPTKGDADANAKFAADRQELKTALDGIGVDTAKMNNAQIRKAIKEAVEKKKAGQTFDQPAYHGSPHIFDRFDLSKIGTGEGAQAYGWGLYFAGKKAVAEYYRAALSRNKEIKWTVDGKPVSGWLDAQEAIRARFSTLIRDSGVPLDNFSKALSGAIADLELGKSIDRAKYEKGKGAPLIKRMLDAVEASVKVEGNGRLYHVEIPDDGAYLHWDKPLSEQSPEVIAALEKIDPEGVRRKDGNIRNSTGEDFYRSLSQSMASKPIDESGMKGWTRVQNTINDRAANDRAASLALREAGIPGIQYLDASSRSTAGGEIISIAQGKDGKGKEGWLAKVRVAGAPGFRGAPGGMSITTSPAFKTEAEARAWAEKTIKTESHNYVLFDDSLAKITTYEQSDTKKELVAVHNLSARNLAHAQKMGGIAAPSIAIVKGAEHSFGGFGEISLIASPSMIDPAQATSKVFGADVYSPRYPQVLHDFKYAELKKLEDRLKPYAQKANARTTLDHDAMEREPVRHLEYNDGFMAEFLTSKGIEPDYSAGAYRTASAFQKQIENAGLKEAFEEHIADTISSMNPKERIFKGFTNSGNRSYKPHTLDVVLKMLTSKIRDGEGFSYGVGNIRAKLTTQFKSIAAIKKADHKLVSKADFTKVKDEINARFQALESDARGYAKYKDGFSSAFIEHLREAIDTRSVSRVLREYYNDPPAEFGVEIADFLNALRNMPTEYFEAKVKRVVGINEFAGAVVPDDASPRTLKMLADNGITDIKTYKSGDDADRTRAVREFQNTAFFQEARGQISFTDNSTIISLFQSRDLSTLIHEGGHLFLAELEFDAKAPDAPEQIKKDWQSVLDWLGSKDGYITREMHEQFARGFETYVMEGKAPSSALASAFRSFKRWLTQIYKRLSALNSPLTPEVREVFDRLIATDEQIATKQDKQGLNPIFKDAKSAGMTKAEFDAYTARANAVVEEAEQRLLQKTMDTIRKQRTKEWKADEKNVREEVTQEVMSESGQQALALLTKGEFPVGTTPEVMKGVKLAKESIVEAYGDESVLTLLPAGIYRDRASGPGVVSPDELAPMLGLGSGKELIERLTQLEAEKRALAAKGDNRSVAKARIDEETAQRMRERYGDPLNDGTIEQEAMAAVHSDKQAALMATDLRILARKAGHTGTVTLEDIQNWAAEAIADKKVRDGTRSEQYARAERDAGKKVERALMKGDFVAAFKAKQDQLVNFALYRESQKAAAEVESARKLMDRYAGAETLKGMDQDYLDQIHQLLETYEFKRRSDTFLAERKSFEDWAIEQEAKGFEVVAPPRLDKGLFSVNYRDMTVDELRGLVDTVKQIAHLGRWKKEMLDGQKKREYEAIIAEAIAAVQAIPQRGVSQVRRGMTNLKARVSDSASLLRSADAALLKMETIFEWLDGDKTGRGIFSRVIFRRMADAQTTERDLQLKLNKQLSVIHDKVPLEQRKKWGEVLTLPELASSVIPKGQLKRSELIAVALNIGNEGNLDKLLRGEKWNEEAVRTVLNKHLTREEWQFVQDAWDLVNSLWPEVEAMERRVNGVAPPKVEAIEVETPYGKLKGGYYPAVYDPKASVEGEKIGAMKAEGLFDSNYRRATTRAGSTKKRTGAAYPMLLSLQVIGQHLNEVAHDIAFREAVIDSYRFLTDKRIKEAVNEALGPEYSKQFEPWVKHIANEWAIDRKGTEDIEKFMGILRTNTTAVGMGLRISTMLSQVAGYANSIQRLGTMGMASGMRAFLKNPAQAAQFVHAQSGEMRHRMNDLERDVRAALQRIEGKSGFKADVQRFAFRGIALFDAAVTIPTWIGAYNKALAEKMTDKDATAYADKMVRDTQGAGSAKDLAAVQRGGELMKLFTMFYSYFNVFYNRQRSLVRDARDMHSAGDAMDVLSQSFWLLVVPSLLAPLLSGQGPDDDEDWGTWVLRNVGFGLFSGLPWVRDAANTASNIAGGKGNFGGTKLSPVQTFWDTAFHVGKDVVHLIEGEDTSQTSIKSAFNFAGLLTGLPTGQVGATSQFLWDALVSGSQNPETLKDWMSGLVYGPERKK